MNWIKCSEKLPIDPDLNGQESEDVLVTNGESICVGYYETEYFIESDPDAYEGQSTTYSSEMWHSDVDFVADNVTHWMPLPNLPEIPDN